MVKGKNKILAALVVVAGLVLTAYALLSPSTDIHSTMMGIQTTSSYSIAGMLLGIIGAFAMASGLAYILFKEDYEPIPYEGLIPSQSVPPKSNNKLVENVAVEPEPVVSAQEAPIDEPVDEKRLVLRLLTGDERTMFRAIVESGGEALQKDLIVKTKMSDAKVSRVLDRLVEKGVISKTRHGVTNKVKIEIES